MLCVCLEGVIGAVNNLRDSLSVFTDLQRKQRRVTDIPRHKYDVAHLEEFAERERLDDSPLLRVEHVSLASL